MKIQYIEGLKKMTRASLTSNYVSIWPHTTKRVKIYFFKKINGLKINSDYNQVARSTRTDKFTIITKWRTFSVSSPYPQKRIAAFCKDGQSACFTSILLQKNQRKQGFSNYSHLMKTLLYKRENSDIQHSTGENPDEAMNQDREFWKLRNTYNKMTLLNGFPNGRKGTALSRWKRGDDAPTICSLPCLTNYDSTLRCQAPLTYPC